MPVGGCEFRAVCGQFYWTLLYRTVKLADSRVRCFQYVPGDGYRRSDTVHLRATCPVLYWKYAYYKRTCVPSTFPRCLRPCTFVAVCAVTFAVATLIGDVEPNPGPITCTSSDNNHAGDNSGAGSAVPTADMLHQLMTSVRALTDAVSRIELSQNNLASGQDSMSKSMGVKLADMEQRFSQQLDSIRTDFRTCMNDIEALNSKCEILEAENSVLREKVEKMGTKLDDLENRSRRNNLIFYGIDMAQKESWADCETKVRHVIDRVLKISDRVSIERAHRVGDGIIVKFLSYKDRELVMSNVRKLKDTKYSVQEDVSPTVRAKQKGLVDMKRSLRSDNKRANIRYDKLYTDDGIYTFDLQTERIVLVEPKRKQSRPSTAESSARPPWATRHRIIRFHDRSLDSPGSSNGTTSFPGVGSSPRPSQGGSGCRQRQSSAMDGHYTLPQPLRDVNNTSTCSQPRAWSRGQAACVTPRLRSGSRPGFTGS
ncbi:hypothetical protein BaRGS_00005828 [Batillaria attramentaria]|uniref:Uncharacterized protein n=1 Tax=Batillaria attramentaria TaxID=370345 RepID=A0ABD0LTE1_9CAEN